jgi:DNA-binding transcriptional ArsR family regulator
MSGENVTSNRLFLIPSSTNATDSSTEMARWSSDEPNRPDEPALKAVLQSLDDGKCRTILSTLCGPTSANELCEECGLSRSTVYRKLELLREAELVREYTEVRRDGPNATLYERDFTDISIGIDDTDEFTIDITRPAADPEEKLASFWSAMKEES